MSICKHISNDGLCLLHSETFYKEPCIEGPCRDYAAMTNADRIRAMTDEELATWLIERIPCHRCPIEECNGGHQNCTDFWLDWLKQEVDCGADMKGEEG